MPQQKPKNDYDELSREIERDVRQAVEAGNGLEERRGKKHTAQR